MTTKNGTGEPSKTPGIVASPGPFGEANPETQTHRPAIAVLPLEGPRAYGAPGTPPFWTTGKKQAIGTARTDRSPVWFTVANGIITEVYYPRVDLANTRDLQFLLVGDKAEDFYEESKSTKSNVQLADPRALMWQISNRAWDGRFIIDKQVLTDPDRPALVMQVRIHTADGPHAPQGLRPYLLFAPHVADRGWENDACLKQVNNRLVLVANRHDTFVALVASLPFEEASAGYVGSSDGWTDLRNTGRLTNHFASATCGNVALCGRVGGDPSEPFTVALGFGQSAQDAVATAIASCDADFETLRNRYADGWHQYCDGLIDLSRAAGDAGTLYYLSAMVIAAHEDRENPGAHTASLAIPWGDSAGEKNRAGYHLVWPRDLYHAATARLAAGDAEGALSTLHYLAKTQREDGSWPQNFWVFGEPYWHGLQLDEIAFPVLLAWQLRHADALGKWNPYPSLIAPAACRIARVGPVTQQERWEENSGYSPSTLAAAIAALVCAAEFATEEKDPDAAAYFLSVADYWADHLEEWTYTHYGSVQGQSEYYERIASVLPNSPNDVGRVFLPVANLPPGVGSFEECAVIDGGFLELVRYGIRKADDKHIVKSVAAYDATCKVETPYGPCWHRYTHDGYGQKDDGSGYDGTGVGRAWPLLTGERGHYELAVGHSPHPLVCAMEQFATEGGMIPEQVWDTQDLPDKDLYLGRPTGSAAPLVWAHAEYVKLLRSQIDGAVFDCPPPVRARYTSNERSSAVPDLVIWKRNHKLRTASKDGVVRIEVYDAAALHWTRDGWRNAQHEPMKPMGHGVWIYDFPPGTCKAGGSLEFTFYWNDPGAWEGTNYVIAMH